MTDARTTWTLVNEMAIKNFQSGIYRMTIGEKFYIGSAVHLPKRRTEHLSRMRRNVHSNRFIQTVWNKHENMTWEVLERCSREALLEREQFHINQHYGKSSCMNGCPQAGNTLGRKHSEATKEKLRLAQQNRMRFKELRQRTAQTLVAVLSTEQAKERMTASALERWRKQKAD